MTLTNRHPTCVHRLVRALAALIIVVAAGTACATDDLLGPARQEAPGPSVTHIELDRPLTDLGFFAPLRPGYTALLKREPPTLAAAYDEATVTVLADVAEVRAGRLIKDLQWVVAELRVSEVLNGSLPPELNGMVLVEFDVAFLPTPLDPIIRRMRDSLPRIPAIWLLKWEGEPPPAPKPGAISTSVDPRFYVLVHANCGVFVQGIDGVVAATAQNGVGSRYAQADGERFTKLSYLAAHARTSR